MSIQRLMILLFAGLGSVGFNIFVASAPTQAREVEAILLKSAIANHQPIESREVVFTITAAANQTFDELTQQAIDLVEQFIEQTFAEDMGVTEVVVHILGDRQGQIVPLLMAEVSRSNWQAQCRIELSARYLNPSSRVLLGFVNSQSAPSAQNVSNVPTERRSVRRGRGRRGGRR